jgi:hypothetical protein
MYMHTCTHVCVLVLTVLLKRVKYTFASTYQRECLILKSVRILVDVLEILGASTHDSFQSPEKNS